MWYTVLCNVSVVSISHYYTSNNLKHTILKAVTEDWGLGISFSYHGNDYQLYSLGAKVNRTQTTS